MKITNQKGFSLLEITLVLGVGVAMTFMKFQDMKSDQENIMANTVGSQMKQMGEAVNRYISIRYDKLSTLTSSSSQSSDPGPRTCSANGCEITYQTLVNEGLLPVSYTGINAQKSAYKILLKRSGTTPNYVINGLVITTQPWSEGNRVRYDLLGRAMQAAGIDSGMTQSATVASGTAGQWAENQNSYSGINAAGLLAYRVGYDSSMYSVYLRRDGTLPMTGDLNMGGHSINNARDITASGNLSIYGVVSAGQELISNNHLTVKNEGYFGGKIATNGLNPHDLPDGWGGGIRTWDIYAVGTIATGSDRTIKFYLNSNGDIGASRHISAGGNITSSGTISGQYFQPTSTSVVGSSCASDGLISKNSEGAILYCQNGEWRGIGGGSITRTATDSLRFQSTGDFNYLNVFVTSKFYPADGTHTGSATFNVLVGGKTVGQITTSITVWKAGSRGHYWGYENTGAALRMFTTAVKQGDVVQVVMASSGFHSSSDISVSLSQ